MKPQPVKHLENRIFRNSVSEPQTTAGIRKQVISIQERNIPVSPLVTKKASQCCITIMYKCSICFQVNSTSLHCSTLIHATFTFIFTLQIKGKSCSFSIGWKKNLNLTDWLISSCLQEKLACLYYNKDTIIYRWVKVNLCLRCSPNCIILLIHSKY